MSGDNRGWYWTSDRLNELIEVVRKLSVQSSDDADQRIIRGGEGQGLVSQVWKVYCNAPGTKVEHSMVAYGLGMLVEFGMIEQGQKHPVNRRFTPGRVDDQMISELRAKRNS